MHYPRNQSAVNALASEWIALQDEIQVDFAVAKVMCTVFWDRRSIFLVDFLIRGEKVDAERYCGPLKKLQRAIQNKRRGILVLVLFCCTITFGHTRHYGQQICRSPVERCLITQHIALTSRLMIPIFSYTSRNSCPVSVFRMTERQR